MRGQRFPLPWTAVMPLEMHVDFVSNGTRGPQRQRQPDSRPCLEQPLCHELFSSSPVGWKKPLRDKKEASPLTLDRGSGRPGLKTKGEARLSAASQPSFNPKWSRFLSNERLATRKSLFDAPPASHPDEQDSFTLSRVPPTIKPIFSPLSHVGRIPVVGPLVSHSPFLPLFPHLSRRPSFAGRSPCRPQKPVRLNGIIGVSAYFSASLPPLSAPHFPCGSRGGASRPRRAVSPLLVDFGMELRKPRTI